MRGGRRGGGMAAQVSCAVSADLSGRDPGLSGTGQIGFGLDSALGFAQAGACEAPGTPLSHEQEQKQDDRNRNSDEPQQNAASHDVLLIFILWR